MTDVWGVFLLLLPVWWLQWRTAFVTRRQQKRWLDAINPTRDTLEDR